SMRFTSGMQISAFNTPVATTVLGAAPGTAFPNAPGASPVTGIGPLPVLASDNSLGSFSAHSGRLYLAYVDRFVTPTGVVPQNPGIAGGETFAPQPYANQPVAPVDAITGNVVDVGPIPDNPGSNNDATFGFGLHQGLAAVGGHIYPVWAGNLNGGNNTRLTQ